MWLFFIGYDNPVLKFKHLHIIDMLKIYNVGFWPYDLGLMGNQNFFFFFIKKSK